MSTPHRLTATFNGLDSIGTVHGEFFSIMSASGPLKPIYEDRGPVTKDMVLTLPYNYDTDDYATRDGGWTCTVVRVNRKTVTVKSQDTGNTHRIEFAF